MYLTHAFLIVKILSYFILSFAVALALEPVLIHFLYKYKAWKKKPREQTFGGEKLRYSRNSTAKRNVDSANGRYFDLGNGFDYQRRRFYSRLVSESLIFKINFLSRSQTWLPLFVLISASLLGLVDDIMVILNKGKYIGGGIRFKVRLALISLIALAQTWWF